MPGAGNGIHVIGDASDETIDGSTLDDTLEGRGGDDILRGLAGDDLLIGGLGHDITNGGPGDDWHFVDDPADQVLEAAGDGNDRVFSSASYVLAAGVEVETLSTDWHAGTDPINLTGNEFAQLIYGNAGDNVLSGGGGADVLIGLAGADTTNGGAGDDWHFVDNAADQALESAGEGNDRVFASVSYALVAGAEVETLSTDWTAGTAAIALTGNELAQLIYGNAGDNTLSGGGGNDRLFGLGGSDTTNGGAGDDWHFVDDAADRVLEAVGEGNDRVFASVTYTLAAGAEVEMLTTDWHAGTAPIGLTGNEFAQVICGNAGNNEIFGGGGHDQLFGLDGNDRLFAWSGTNLAAGGRGDDTFFVDDAGDQVVEAVGEGFDTVNVGLDGYVLTPGAEVEYMYLTWFSPAFPTAMSGNEFGQTLEGQEWKNVLDGKGGNDLLRGWSNADDFVFTTVFGPAVGNVDTLADFKSGEDRILLDDAVFTGLTPGGLPAGAFRTGAVALDADDRILYNPVDGALLFDADGNGAIAAVQFAVSATAPIVTDFVVI